MTGGEGRLWSEWAPGKVNLGLRVLGPRADGFHEIDSLFLRLDLRDELRGQIDPVASGPAAGTQAAGSAAATQVQDQLQRVPSGDAYLDALPLDLGPGNLIHLALAAYRRQAAAVGVVLPRLRLVLRKRLPWGAGLGGGSADAAATLRLAERIAPAGLDLQALARELGSDLPFSLSGLPAARVGGRGELLRPVELRPRWLVLAFPGVPVSAADAYRWWAAQPVQVPGMDPVLQAMGGSAPWPRLLNALQPGVATRVPEVAEALALLQSCAAGPVSMSGSGSTCLALAGDAEEAEVIRRKVIEARPGWWVVAAQASVTG